ncbi:tetratricopeptide repeat protein [Legionella gresilensis]|uniref:tetratricopeptide repeat protein n=1 Tax=Legionella gresilensis TaxID=91823 RepID=UPI0010417392|nr:hypothetical protein [Legionella gresilensis]
MKVVSDLNATVLCPFQLVADISFHLEKQFLKKNTVQYQDDSAHNLNTLKSHLFQQVCPLETPTDWVNLDDSVGDLVAMRGYELNKMLIPLLQIKKLELHILLGAKALNSDNLYSLIFLANSFSHLSVHFYLDSESMTHLQPNLTLIKEKITVNYHPTLHMFKPPSMAALLENIKLNRQGILYGQGFNFCEQKKQLSHSSVIHYAWKCLKAGAYNLSCQVLEEALTQNNLPNPMKEEFFLQLQVIRFLSHQHHLVSRVPLPEKFETINDLRTAYLYFIQAFSATMTHNLKRAEICFTKANIHMDLEISDEDSIYKLNLYALFLVLQGNSEKAYTLETKLINYIDCYYPTSTAINHVIRMNIARLYKKSKQFKKAEIAYHEAYSQLSSGGFTLFDFINYEMDKGILFEAQGKIHEAISAWIKVTLYWLTCPNPYSLAVRPRLVLCQEKVTDTITPLSLEKVNQFLLQKLKTLSSQLTCTTGKINITKYPVFRVNINTDKLSTEKEEMFHFISDTVRFNNNKTCHVMDDMVIYSYDCNIKDQSKSYSLVEKSLRIFVTRLLKQRTNISDNTKAIAIETVYDLTVPKSEEAAITQASLADCNGCNFYGKYVDISIETSATYLRNVAVKFPTMLNEIRHTPNSVHLNYRRSFLNKVITCSKIIALIKRLENGEFISVDLLKNTWPDQFIQMVNQKIIVVEMNAHLSSDKEDSLNNQEVDSLFSTTSTSLDLKREDLIPDLLI